MMASWSSHFFLLSMCNIKSLHSPLREDSRGPSVRKLKAVHYLLNLKRPSQERQNSSHGLGMMGRSHLGIAPAYIVVLKELNMRWRALM